MSFGSFYFKFVPILSSRFLEVYEPSSSLEVLCRYCVNTKVLAIAKGGGRGFVQPKHRERLRQQASVAIVGPRNASRSPSPDLTAPISRQSPFGNRDKNPRVYGRRLRYFRFKSDAEQGGGVASRRSTPQELQALLERVSLRNDARRHLQRRR